MAGDWIKMRADLLPHPKVVRSVSALKADKLRVIGGLHAVWSLFDTHSADGTLDGYTAEALDDYIGWPGFCAAMVLVGWLEENGESLTTPRFDEHNGQSAKRRATETQRKRMARENPEMSAPDADKLRSREEKRREDKKEEGEKPRATRLPPDFEPKLEPEAESGIDRAKELANFRDYWNSKAHNNTKLDWQATWRQWARKADRPGQSRFPDKNAPAAVSTVWHESAAGVRARAEALGVAERDLEAFPTFKARVMAADRQGATA